MTELKKGDKVCVIGTIRGSKGCLVAWETATEYEMEASAAPEDDYIYGLSSKFKPDPTPMIDRLASILRTDILTLCYHAERLKASDWGPDREAGADCERRAKETEEELVKVKAWLESK